MAGAVIVHRAIRLKHVVVMMRTFDEQQTTDIEWNVTEWDPSGVQILSAATHEDNVAMGRATQPWRDRSHPREVVMGRLATEEHREERHNFLAVDHVSNQLP